MRRVLLLLLFAVTPASAQFAIGFGGGGDDCGRALVVDPSNDIILGAAFEDTVNPGTSPATRLVSAGGRDAALLRYNQVGELLRARRFGGAETDEIVTGLGIDNSGNIHVAGWFGTTADSLPHSADFDPSGGGTLTTRGGYDGFLAKYDADGNHLWSLSLGNTTGSTAERCLDIAVDTGGNSYVTGVFHGTVDFNPRGAVRVWRTTTSTSAGIFLAKYNGAGINLWVVAVDAGLDDTSDEAHVAVAYNRQKGVFWSGNFRGAGVDFNPWGLTPLSSAGETDMFLADYNALGLLLWAKRFGGPARDIVAPGGMRLDQDGNPGFTGRVEGPVVFDSSAGITVADTGMFVASFTALGACRAAIGLASEPGSVGSRVAFDPAGNLYLGGSMHGIVDFDPVAHHPDTALSPVADLFLAKYTPELSLLWIDHFGSADTGAAGNAGSVCGGLEVDKQDFPCITGGIAGRGIDFDPSPIDTLLLSGRGARDCVVAQYNELGLFGAAVPVELRIFSATPVADGVELRWITVSETANFGFEIERALPDDDRWTAIGFATGGGTTTREREYRHLDASPTAVRAERLRYRIVQIDYDGRRTPLPMVELARGPLPDFAVLARWPEPASSHQAVCFALRDPADVTLTVTDVRGIRRAELTRWCGAGTHVAGIPVADLPSGIYHGVIAARLNTGGTREARFTVRVMR